MTTNDKEAFKKGFDTYMANKRKNEFKQGFDTYIAQKNAKVTPGSSDVASQTDQSLRDKFWHMIHDALFGKALSNETRHGMPVTRIRTVAGDIKPRPKL